MKDAGAFIATVIECVVEIDRPTGTNTCRVRLAVDSPSFVNSYTTPSVRIRDTAPFFMNTPIVPQTYTKLDAIGVSLSGGVGKVALETVHKLPVIIPLDKKANVKYTQNK